MRVQKHSSRATSAGLARLVGHSASELEERLNAAGVPAARVRTLREFTQEAVQTGMLQPVILGAGDALATTPGLGWRPGPSTRISLLNQGAQRLLAPDSDLAAHEVLGGAGERLLRTAAEQTIAKPQDLQHASPGGMPIHEVFSGRFHREADVQPAHFPELRLSTIGSTVLCRRPHSRSYYLRSKSTGRLYQGLLEGCCCRRRGCRVKTAGGPSPRQGMRIT